MYKVQNGRVSSSPSPSPTLSDYFWYQIIFERNILKSHLKMMILSCDASCYSSHYAASVAKETELTREICLLEALQDC